MYMLTNLESKDFVDKSLKETYKYNNLFCKYKPLARLYCKRKTVYKNEVIWGPSLLYAT